MGDLNINLLEHQTHQKTGNYLAVIQSLTIFQLLVDQHAFQWGIKGEMSRCLITFTLTSLYHPSQELQYDISDHLPVTQKHGNLNYKIKFKIFNETNKALFTRRLCNIDWEDIVC